MKPLFQIFSKSRIKEKAKPKIIVDYRERSSLIISELVSLGIVPEVKELKVADYIVKRKK